MFLYSHTRLRQGMAAVTLAATGLFVAVAGASAEPADGTLDTSFNDVQGTGFDNWVRSTDLMADGSFIVGGTFGSYDGTPSGKIARILADGSVDAAFGLNVGAGPNGQLGQVRVLADQTIILTGQLQFFHGVTTRHIAKLNSDGTLDETFAAATTAEFNNTSRAVAQQPNGQLLVGGAFTQSGGASGGLARLNLDGSRDSAFDAAVGVGPAGVAFAAVDAIAVQPDGKILAGGRFPTFAGVASSSLVRLNPDGSVDTAFSANLGLGFNQDVGSIAVLPDGSVAVGGVFTSLDGTAANRMVVLNADGTRNTAYDAGLGAGFDAAVQYLAVEPSGALLVGGDFTTLNGTTTGPMLRLNPDASLDTVFTARAGSNFDDTIASMTPLPDGDVVVGGLFTHFDGTPVGRLALLTAITIQITNPGNQTTPIDTAVSLPIIASASDAAALSYSATGLPTGLSIEATTGVISGTVTTPGTYTVEVTASHTDGPAASTSFTWTVTATSQPTLTIVNPGDHEFVLDGTAITLPVVAISSDDGVITFDATGLPPGLTIDPATGVISGTPSTVGRFRVTVTASELGAESVSTTFTVTVAPAAPRPTPSTPVSSPTPSVPASSPSAGHNTPLTPSLPDTGTSTTMLWVAAGATGAGITILTVRRRRAR